VVLGPLVDKGVSTPGAAGMGRQRLLRGSRAKNMPDALAAQIASRSCRPAACRVDVTWVENPAGPEFSPICQRQGRRRDGDGCPAREKDLARPLRRDEPWAEGG